MKKTLIMSAVALAMLVIISMSLSVKAHTGKTDSKGGHTNHSTGEYHYHHGYSAHDHYDMDGDGIIDCPYEFRDNTKENQSNKADDTDKLNIHIRIAEPGKTSYSDVISAIFEHLFLGIPIWLFSSYFLFYVFYLIFGEEQGCSISMIAGAVISIAVCIWLIISKLS